MQFSVEADRATALRRQKGTQVTIVNQSAVNVYMSDDPQQLNGTAFGVAPNGMLIAAFAAGPPPTAGQVQIDNFKGVVWLRAAAQTIVEVYP